MVREIILGFLLSVIIVTFSLGILLGAKELVADAECKERGWPRGKVTVFFQSFCVDAWHAKKLDEIMGESMDEAQRLPGVPARQRSAARNLPVPTGSTWGAAVPK